MSLEMLGIEEDDKAVYFSLLAEPEQTRADMARALGLTEDRVTQCLDKLAGLALIRRSEKGGLYMPVNPGIAVEALLSIEQAELSRRHQKLMEARVELSQLVDTAVPRRRSPEAIERLNDTRSIVSVLAQLAAQCRTEVVNAVPSTAIATAGLETARQQDLALIARGVRCRLLYTREHTANLAYRTYLHTLQAAGAEVKITSHLPHRLLIFDRAVCFLPISHPGAPAGALVVRERAMIDNFLLLFDSFWSHASELEDDRPGSVETALNREILVLMSSGVKDETAARQLNISHRTYRRHVAELMEELNAESRFQAGVEAVRRGWL